MQIFGLSDIGNVRENNQDRFGFKELESGALAIVCDGMGGANAGSEASELTLSELLLCAGEKLNGECDLDKSKSILRNCLRNINKKLYTRSLSDEKLKGMGTTVVLFYQMGNESLFINVGDSRAYLIHDSQIKRITTDHSIVEEMVQTGHITEEEARVHPNRNIITMAIGPEEEILPNHYALSLSEGDIIILCSDGLTSMVSDEEILEISLCAKIDKLPKSLIEKAKEKGGLDNITVIAALAL